MLSDPLVPCPQPAEEPAAPARRPALRWLAAGLLLPLLAACRTDGGVPPTERPTRWPPGGR